ncbi:hypothetical protein K456DRAFT_55098 [Colletotrichum gloeosporioides 23]|nr:hypothetical protein K456DRAFT_55098 [Colletotrichum gloeosporioides 23]
MYGNFTSEVWDLSGPEKGFLAAESHNPLKLLYAQDIYSAFVWAAGKEATTQPIPGGAEEIQHIGTTTTNNNNYW